MGFFNKFKKKFNSAVGLGKNNDLLNAVPLFGAISMAEKGSIGDAIMGKKSKDIKPDDIATQIRNTQTKGIGELNAALDGDSGENTVRLQNAQAQKGILTSAQDARRNAQKMMAQSGLKGTSLGLASNRSIDQTAGRDLATVNAQLPGQIRNQKLQDAQTRISVGGVNQNGMNFNTIEGQRSGGLLGFASAIAPAAGAIAGGMYGGPAGAAAGGQMGQGMGSGLQQQQNPNGFNKIQNPYSPDNYSMGNFNFNQR